MPSGEIIKLETQLLGGEQGLSLVFGIWIGCNQCDRADVVAGDPGGATRVQNIRSVAEAQRKPVMFQEGDPQHGIIVEPPAAARTQLEHGLEQWLCEAQLTPKIVQRMIFVPQQVGLASSSFQHHFPPRATSDRHSARQRRAGFHRVPGAHLALARQRAEHPGVRGEQQRAQRHAEVVRQPAQCLRGRVDPHHMLTDAGHRVECPSRDRREPTGEEHGAPELPAGFISGHRGSVFAQTDTAHFTSSLVVCSLAGFPPHSSRGGTYSPFMRKELAARAEPSLMVTP